MTLHVLLFHHSFHRRHNGLGHRVDLDVDFAADIETIKRGQAKRFRDEMNVESVVAHRTDGCLLYTSPSPRDR